MFPELHRYPYFSYDTETTGLNWPQGDKAFGFSISTPDGRDDYYDIREQPNAIPWINDTFKRYRGIVIAHNCSFDHHMSRNSGIHVPLHLMDDTVIRACLIDEHLLNYSLDALAKKYLGEQKEVAIYEELAALFGGRKTRNVQMPNLHRAPSSLVSPYAKKDSHLTLKLWKWQRDEIGRQGIERIVDWERSLMPMLIENEQHGVRVDVDAAEVARDQLTDAIDQMQFQLNDICGVPMNPQPSDELRDYMAGERRGGDWFAIDGTPLNTTGTGLPSINQEALQKMVHPAAKAVLELRKLLKLRDTFINGHILSNQINSRIHPRIHQSKGPDGGTGTGRFSYSDPALQQIPSRDKALSSIIRPIFLPEEGHVWVDGDMASFEVRIFVHLVNNPVLIEEYRRFPETDLHEYVAGITGLPRNKPPEGGPNAKQLNLSMIFNQGKGATAEALGLPWEWDHWEEKNITFKRAGPEAEEIIERYHSRVPGVRYFAKDASTIAEKRGWVFTKRGRRLRFPNGFKAYKASGLLIQATAADLNKENWSLITDALGDEGRLLLNTHDSYGLSLPEGNVTSLAERVKTAVEQDRQCRVPLLLELNKPGKNWWESYNGEPM